MKQKFRKPRRFDANPMMIGGSSAARFHRRRRG